MKYQLYSKRLNRVDDGSSYKLLQLTPELLSFIEDESITDKKLTLKATDASTSDVVLCTDKNTFVLKQKMHSNCVLVMERSETQESVQESVHTYKTYSMQSSELEPRKIEGKILVDQLPLYDGNNMLRTNFTRDIEFAQFIKESPCSIKEFYHQWYEMNGCRIDGIAVLLSEKYITKTLHVLILSIIAQELEFDKLQLSQCIDAVIPNISESQDTEAVKDVIESVLKKFSDSCDDIYKMNFHKVATMYGINALQKNCISYQYMNIDDFMIKWKSSFPPFFQCDIDLQMLLGHYCQDMNNNNKITYVDLSVLPQEPKMRFSRLFQIQKSWLQQEIWPFLKDLNTQNLKPDTFIIKYARRKRLKRDKFIVTSR